MGAERSLIREDAEDVTSLAVVITLLLLATLLTALLTLVPALTVIDAGHGRRRAFLRIATTLATATVPVALGWRRAIRWPCRAR